MTVSSYAPWPFRPFSARLPEENARWWQTCYLPGMASRIAAGWPHWCIIAGGPGSGKSTAVLELERREAAQSLIVPYPIEHWPGGRLALNSDTNHLAQMLACAGLTLREHFSNDPARLDRLTPAQRKFIRWLLDTFVDERAFTRWIEGLPPNVTEQLQATTYQELYKTTTQPRDIRGQIDELAQLARRLGYQRILFTCDLNAREAQTQVENLKQLFKNLELMHDAGLALIAALPTEIVKQADLVKRARGRVSMIHLDWTLEQVREIATRHLRAALSDVKIQLEDYVTRPLLKSLEDRLVADFDGYAPQGWIMLAETLLHLIVHPARPLQPPLKLSQHTEIVAALYTRHMPLELADKGVWRGSKFIPLNPQPLEFVKILWEKAGEPIHADDPELREREFGASYVPTLARRVRSAIEPEPSAPIYLCHDRGEGGYWLENVTYTAD